METVDGAWREGVELFDAGQYWHCHEALERIWLPAEGVEKRFLGGLILLAACLHKARALNSPRGGRRNYAKALLKLSVVKDRYRNVDVRELEWRVHRALLESDFHPTIPRSAGFEGDES